MIIGPDYVFLCVPRTASHSISTWLCEHYGGVARPDAEYHRRDVPPEHAHKFTFAVVRNPYERVASLWRMLQRWPVEERPCGDCSLDAFPDWLMRANEIEPDTPQWLPQEHFLSLARIDALLIFERLPHMLPNLPFVEDRPLPVVCNETARALTPEFSPRFRRRVLVYEYEAVTRWGGQWLNV